MDPSLQPKMRAWVAGSWTRLARLSIPFLVVAMLAIWVAGPKVVWESRPLLMLLAYGPTALALSFIVIPAAGHFLDSGRFGVLMLGCGMWVISLGVIGGAGLASRSLDLNWAVYDSAFLLSALCHFAGVARSPRLRIPPERTAAWLAAAYGGGLAAVGLCFLGAVTGRMPAFYLAGQGETLLRGLMLTATVALFLLTAGLLWQTHRRAPSPFLYWYALGLVLIAAGLAGSSLIQAVDSPLQWTTRATRALGTVYLCVAVLEVRAPSIPMEAVADTWREPAFLSRLRRHTGLGWTLRYLAAAALVAAAFWTHVALTRSSGPGLPPYILFYPAVMASAVLGGLGPGALATGLAVLAAGHRLLPSSAPFGIPAPMDRLGLVIFSAMGLAVTFGAEYLSRYREKAAAYDREEAMQGAARAAHERFHLALSCMTFAALLVTEDDRVDFANQAFCDLFRVPETPGQLRGLTSGQILARIGTAYRDPEQGLARIIELVHRGVLVQDEEVLLRGGEICLRDFIPIRQGDRSFGRLWIHKDITERRQAEAALRENQARLEAIFAAIPDVIVEYDLAGGIVRANQAAISVGGFDRLDFTNRQALERLRFRRIDGSPLEPGRSPSVRALRGEHVAGELYAITTQDRGERVIAAYAAPLHKDQEINGVVALWHDVTELKRAEEAMRELSLQLTEEARRKDEFLAHLGHELRNPLVPIGNAVYLMRKAGPDRELLENACAIAEHQVAHIARLVDDLLDVSRIARGKVALKKEAVDLVQVMQGVVRDYQPVFAENQLALEVSLPQEPLWIEADRARVIQVASNLLQNAIKFTDPGGRVSLSVSVPEKGWSQVAVQDSGAGIPPRLLRSIFEPFMQSEATLGRARGGLGLGLALAKGLVELHGGTISARSDGPGLGAQFIVRLPAAPAVGQPETPAAQPAQAARRRRVLVVEDLPDAATTLRLLLEMAGHEVAVAHDGRAALEQAGSFGPEIILCDIGLPGDLDGYAVARAIRATPGLERTRLVAMTGFGSAGVRDKASLAVFDLTLIKPVEPEALVQVIAAEP